MKRFTKNIGMLLLAIWLILYGLIALFSLSFTGLGSNYGTARHRGWHLHITGPLEMTVRSTVPWSTATR